MQTTIVFWLAGMAWLSCAGWILAALHQINPLGYVLTLLPGFLIALAWLKRHPPRFRGKVFLRRFRRPFPVMFLLVAGLVILGGVLHAPNNYDGLTYRLPRMLNWFMAGKWYWIPTVNERMNCANTDWEWAAMPLLVLLRSDRGMFLINATGFLLMPGLLFSVFRRLGVARRVAWTWMWVLPLAYGYTTQAGGIGNDFTGVVLCLMALYFALRARHSGRIADLWLTIVAAALMTGVKVTNAPLGLPCLVAVWPALGNLRKRVAGSIAVASIALLISAVPTMVLNRIHTGSLTGDPQNSFHMDVKNPAAGLLGNSLLLAEQTLMPPVLPAAGKVMDRINRTLPAGAQHLLRSDFPRYYQNRLDELPAEESAGLGLGMALPLMIAVGATILGFGRPGSGRDVLALLPPVALAAWVASLVYMAKVGTEAGPRLMLPYYPLVIVPLLLLPVQGRFLRFRTWRVFLMLMALSTLPAMVLSASRPLWPGASVCRKLLRTHPGSRLLERMVSVYETYGHRNDPLAPLRAGLPASAREVGLVADSDDSDYSLWRPFGHRRVVDVGTDGSRFQEHAGEYEWLVVNQAYWHEVCPIPLADWARQNHATIVKAVPIVEVVSAGPKTWYLLHVEPN